MSKNLENKFFCPLPWKHLSVEPTGKVYSCCNAKPNDFLGDLKESSLEEVWTGPIIESLREEFRNGRVPSQCETCKFQESIGQISLREASEKEYPKSDIDLSSSGDISYFGLRFGNTCNFSCRMCSSGLSTSWYSDNLALGEKNPDGALKAFDENKFSKLLEMILKTGECLYFAGGEPFMLPEFYRVLNYLLENKKTDIKIMINSNSSLLNLGDHDGIELMGNFKNLYIELSLDDYGPRSEYSRKGTIWKKVEENIQIMRNAGLRVVLTPTISIFNIYYIDEIIHYFLKNLSFQPKDIRATVLRAPEEYNISILDESLKKKIRTNLTKLKKNLLLQYDLKELDNLLIEIQGMVNALDKKPKSTIEKFKLKTKKLDEIRGESFEEIFPELFDRI